ncbi:MAG: hypothetical protein ACYDCS_08145 [Candidatus Dormibacteria bacterium]
MALLPGVFALLLAGASGVAAAPSPSPSPTATPTTSPTPTPRVCRHGTRPDGSCCPRRNPCTATPSPTATPTATPPPAPSPTGGGRGAAGGVGSTPAPTPAPTKAPVPTPKPVASSGGSSTGHSGAAGEAGATEAIRTQTPVDPTPFAPLTSAVRVVTSGQGLDAARIPPVEALTPLSGLEFGNGLNLGPILLLIDLIGIGMLVYLVRTRWLAHEG